MAHSWRVCAAKGRKRSRSLISSAVSKWDLRFIPSGKLRREHAEETSNRAIMRELSEDSGHPIAVRKQQFIKDLRTPVVP